MIIKLHQSQGVHKVIDARSYAAGLNSPSQAKLDVICLSAPCTSTLCSDGACAVDTLYNAAERCNTRMSTKPLQNRN